MIVVSGCPRSGTSLMMDCLRLALGEDRLIGHKFPQEHGLNESRKQFEDETYDHYEARMYSLQRVLALTNKERDIERSKDLNPNGFWECRYTVQGIKWHLGIDVKDSDVCKIVSQGLYRSNPQYINKIIYMARNPRQVAKSQERLRRMPFIPAEEEESLHIHTPEMFIGVTSQAAVWIDDNKDIPLLLVNFDDLIAYPDESLARVRDFLGEGDFSTHQINPKLKRSDPEDIPHHLWEYADHVYELLKEEKWEDIIKYCIDNSEEIAKENRSVFCTRLNRRMVYNECVACKGSAFARKNFRKQAESSGIGWKNEPCIFECVASLEEPHISMRESIDNNFWIE